MGNLNTMKITSLVFAVWALALSNVASATSYKTVLIHGFQPQQLLFGSANTVSSDGESYWADYWGALADERIDWPSFERVEGKIATDYVWPKLKSMSERGVCDQGCVFVTHSTGDLVARYIIDNQANWLNAAGLKPLNIIATFDIAGAGGGSELADLAVNVTQGATSWNPLIEAALQAWLGGPLTDKLGVLNDLKVNNARQLAALPSDRAPRLRFVGEGDLFLGATKLFLKGKDDSVVASHSSCGSSKSGDFGSCSSSIAFDGKISSQGDAVKSFMPNHYPMLMSDNYDHLSIILNKQKGKVTAANDALRLDNGDTISFSTYQKDYGFWIFKTHYKYVSQSDSQSMSKLIYNTL
ncbi:hypothetical protein [Pseudoalteromonas phenolica]|uniref:Alpha/beta hydrolase n=1 Tax=Pseudoalteromonas phenolica TaxID=161398 RepID=A0A0S2K0E5_9GAMM|nr:hypothetical protein [Pseudoalteromonas phenolica]ALO41962.1 hypothetical protein PP2015_1458 [Pseudoalteromonas phenolica]MBE0353475.1 hypothetical protein [Pseudoalteromonas phenolica O-BC30]RXE94922.1 hypothetical protein D9981_17500 [Pseudoalteromonas phenolica O-BC30]TMO55301.1 hypothetical protein CWC21_11475 [Pseudoalteromonas phenolica]